MTDIALTHSSTVELLVYFVAILDLFNIKKYKNDLKLFRGDTLKQVRIATLYCISQYCFICANVRLRPMLRQDSVGLLRTD